MREPEPTGCQIRNYECIRATADSISSEMRRKEGMGKKRRGMGRERGLETDDRGQLDAPTINSRTAATSVGQRELSIPARRGWLHHGTSTPTRSDCAAGIYSAQPNPIPEPILLIHPSRVSQRPRQTGLADHCIPHTMVVIQISGTIT